MDYFCQFDLLVVDIVGDQLLFRLPQGFYCISVTLVPFLSLLL